MKNPVVSFAPGIGVDIYLSPVAMVAGYNLNMDINLETVIRAKPESGSAYSLKNKGMYHFPELGIKITFPFRFTDDDGILLLN